MALRSASIPNLLNGVSEQPEVLRDPTQGGDQLNLMSSVVEGLSSRPPMDYIGFIEDIGEDFTDAFVHFIYRDTSERYAVIIRPDGDITIFDLIAGSEVSVATPDGIGYLTTTDPKNELRAVTVADHTFIVNRNKTVAMLGDLSPVGTLGAIVNVVQGAYSATYNIHVGGGTILGTYTTLESTEAGAEADIATDNIASELAADADASANWTASVLGNSIHIARETDGSAQLHINDSIGGNGMILVRGVEQTEDDPLTYSLGRVQVFSDLPDYGANGIITQVVGDPGTRFDNFWLQSSGASAIGNIKWVEVVRPRITYKLDPNTMPHLLVREAGGTFTFEEATWDDRAAGDAVTNPDPAFVGSMIEDIFFFGNRLGTLTGETVMMSETGKFFNFFRQTATTVLDTDPINVSATTNEVALLKYAVPYQERMLVFADNLNFELKGDPLTPNTASLNVLMKYSMHPDVRPIAAGQSVFWAFNREDFTGIREFIGDLEDGDEARDITEHVPSFIGGSPYALTHSDTEDLLFVAKTVLDSRLAVYKYFWQYDQQGGGRKKVQSSWSGWQFPARVLQISAIDHYLYMLTLTGDVTDVVTISRLDLRAGLTEDDMDYKILLDFKIYHDDTDLDLSYSAGNDETTVTIPVRWHEDNDDRAMAVRLFTDDEENKPAGEMILPTSVDGDTGVMVFDGDITSEALVFGLHFTCVYRFTSPTVRERRQGGDELGAPITEGRLTLLFWAINLINTGSLRARITLPNGKITRYEFNEEILTDPQAVGALKTGVLKFPIRSDARDPNLIMEVLVEWPFPVHMVNAGWEGNFSIRSKRF